MWLPNRENAVVDLAKLVDYCLNAQHEEGRHKARVFAAALNLGQEDAPWLAAEILSAARTCAATEQDKNAYGQRFVIDFDLRRNGRAVRVRSAWIVRSVEGFPRLTSCYVL